MHFTICDVFTDTPLEGNQLAVFGDGASVPDALQQPLAREINFSETVFVYPPDDPANTARIRIYVPTAEIPFAGHPVIGTAVVLAGQRGLNRLVLETGAGPIEVSVEGSYATMHQPIPTVAPFAARRRAARDPRRRALGAAGRGVRQRHGARLRRARLTRGGGGTRAGHRGASPGCRLSTGNEGSGFNCFAGSGTRWKTRMFAPAQIAGEDPATGSAAGPLACHAVRHGLVALGTEITISQGAEIGRPSTLYARVEGDSPDAITEVAVSGHAVDRRQRPASPPGE